MGGILEKIPSFLDGSICNECGFRSDCPMIVQAKEHITRMIAYNTEDYSNIDPAAYDEYATELPDFDADAIIWCPWFGGDE